jgi:hypothetical protein
MMQHLEGSGTPVLYMRRTVFKGKVKSNLVAGDGGLDMSVAQMLK